MDISIIIPTRNSADSLRETLASVLGIAPAGAVEVIVVDNGSVDETEAVVESARLAHRHHHVRYVYDDEPGLLTGRHRGAMEAGGEVLAYLDDDVLLGRSWYEGIRDAFGHDDVVLAGGPSRPLYQAPPPPWLSDFVQESEHGWQCGCLSLIDQGNETKVCPATLVWGLNYAIRKDALFQYGGFHPDCIPVAYRRYQGDGETGLSLAIERAGQQALYHPGMEVEHRIASGRLTPEAFEARAFYQGVCDSYTTIRADGALVDHGLLRENFRALRHAWQVVSQKGAASMNRRYKTAHVAGFRWHRKQVQRDSGLLSWILQPDYFDYRLPPTKSRQMCKRSDNRSMACGADGVSLDRGTNSLQDKRGKSEWYQRG